MTETPYLAPRPAASLRELERLQDLERRGVEGDAEWTGHGRSMREALLLSTAEQTAADAPQGAGPLGIPDEYIVRIAESIADRERDVEQTVADIVAQAPMGRHPAQWSRFEHPVASDVLMGTASSVEAAIAALGSRRRDQSPLVRALAGEARWTLSDPQRPAIGTLSTGQLLATAQPAGKGSVVLVENGLLPTARLLAQVGFIGGGEALEQQRLSTPTVQAVSDLVAGYLATGHLLGFGQRSTPPAVRPYVYAIEDALLTFVLAHEYGHILNGDLAMHPITARNAVRKDIHRKEFAADIAALRIALVVGADSPVAPGAGLWGALLYLAGLDVLVRADAAMHHEEPELEDGRDRPTPYDRVRNLLHYIERSGLTVALGEAARAASVAYHCVLFAWDIVAPVVWAMGDAAGPRGTSSIPEYELSAAREVMWAEVSPRVAGQRLIC